MNDEQATIAAQEGRVLTVSYKVDGLLTGNATRATMAAATDAEKTVKTLRLYFFNYSDDGSGTYIAKYDVPDTEIGNGLNGTFNVIFPTTSGLVNSKAYTILAIANAPASLANIDESSFAGLTETEFIQQNKYTTTGTTLDANDTNLGWGDWHPLSNDNDGMVMTQRYQKLAQDQSIDLLLERVVSRFDVRNNYSGYQLVSASIWNAATTELYWATVSGIQTNHTKRFYGIESDKTGLGAITNGGLYALENYVESSTQTDTLTTCLVVGMQKDDEDTVQYFRVNIVNKNQQYLKRNYLYTITISRVKAQGAKSEIDAVNQQQNLGLDINVNDWNVDPGGSVIVDNEGNMLAVGTTNLQMTPESKDYTIQIFAVGEKTLRLSRVQIPTSWTVKLAADQLLVHADASDITLNGIVELEFGTLKTTINLTQSGNTDQYITLDNNTTQMFPSNANEYSTPVRITSSGPWTAKIYNNSLGGVFAFAVSGNPTEITGVSGDRVTFVTTGTNDDVLPKYAFVQFILDANSEETVTLVLGQRGAGGVSITPAASTLAFNAFGEVADPNATNTFQVTTDQDSNPEWEIIAQGGNTDAFTIDHMSGDYSNHVFTITADSNRTASPLQAQYRIQLKNKPSVGKSLTVTEAVQTITLNPSTLTDLALDGGKTPNIIVTSSNKWTATLDVTNGKAHIGKVDGDNLTTLKGVSGETFFIEFEKNTIPNVVPTATVTVSIDGTVVQTQIVAKQKKLNPRQISVRKHMTQDYYQMGFQATPTRTGNPNYVAKYLFDSSNFGPKGVVYTTIPLQLTVGTNTDTPNPAFASDMGIYYEDTPYSDNHTNESITWKNSDKARNFVIVPVAYWDNWMVPYMNALYGSGASGYAYAENLAGPANVAVTPQTAEQYSEDNERGQKLWEYLTKTGPFTGATPIDLGDLVYQTGPTDEYNRIGFSQWPSTMIPIIMLDPSHCSMGIDPANNVCYLNTQIFNSMYNNYGDNSPQARFLKNILAYIVNAAQYGTDFTGQFVDEP
ncbi:MAG: hypothetical protein LBN24_08710 [Mediterranea sp.]|nr:hypothetical protein [Mediterranea sp.]